MDVEKRMKYIVVMEIEDTGFMNCIGVFDNYREAYGEAYLALCDSYEIGDTEHYISLAADREGECGMIIELINKRTGKVEEFATVLFYDEKDENTPYNIIKQQKEKRK